jgi:hypothetical protein
MILGHFLDESRMSVDVEYLRVLFFKEFHQALD